MQQEQRPRRFLPFRLGMVGMGIAACIVFLLSTIFCLLSSMHAGNQKKNLAYIMTHDITCAIEAYRMMAYASPPNTGQIDLATGTTAPFAPGESAEADTICRYLGGGGRRRFLVIHPLHIKTVNSRQLMVDPWGNPYRVDIFAEPKVTPPGDPQFRIRVWSLGPDGKEGPVPFSRVQTITDPRDEDNIASW